LIKAIRFPFLAANLRIHRKGAKLDVTSRNNWIQKTLMPQITQIYTDYKLPEVVLIFAIFIKQFLISAKNL